MQVTKITEVHIEFVRPKDGLIGFASLIIDGSFYLSCIAIHKKLNSSGYRLTYPNKGKFPIFFPINKSIGKLIEQHVLEQLKDVMNKKKNHEYQ